LIIRGENPKKTINGAAKMTIDQCKEFQKQFKNALKA